MASIGLMVLAVRKTRPILAFYSPGVVRCAGGLVFIGVFFWPRTAPAGISVVSNQGG